MQFRGAGAGSDLGCHLGSMPVSTRKTDGTLGRLQILGRFGLETGYPRVTARGSTRKIFGR